MCAYGEPLGDEKKNEINVGDKVLYRPLDHADPSAEQSTVDRLMKSLMESITGQTTLINILYALNQATGSTPSAVALTIAQAMRERSIMILTDWEVEKKGLKAEKTNLTGEQA